MRLPDSFLQELKDRNNILDVVSGYVNLKRSGRTMSGLCPFHGEKTPSFHVNAEQGYFHCFGCGAGGDVITFIRKIENLDYIDAVKFLAQRAGMELPEDGRDEAAARIRGRIYEANREAARFFHRCLYSEEGKNALAYLRGRGLTERTIKHFGLGYSPNSRYALVRQLHSLGFRDEEIIRANLGFQGRYGSKGALDRFADRVMFPIIDLRGNVIGFGGRIMTDQKPKYLNTSDTMVFNKSQNLYALNFAKNAGEKRLILAEGYMDVIALHQAGFPTAVATLGTSLTTEQARLIARYAQEVVICYDSDGAGQKATARAIPMLREAGLLVRVLTVTGGKDPDEFIRSHGDQGPARFKQLLEASGNDVEYRLQKAANGLDLSQPDGKIAYLTACVSILATLDSKIEQEVYAGRIAAEVEIEKSSVMAQVEKQMRKRRRSQSVQEFREIQKATSGFGDAVNPQKSQNLRAANAEEALTAYVINNPDMANNIEKWIRPEDFVTDFNRRVYETVTERIRENRPVSPTDLTQDFSEQEMSRIAGMLYKASIGGETLEAAKDYCKIIKQEKSSAKLREPLKDDEAKRLFEEIQKNKLGK